MTQHWLANNPTFFSTFTRNKQLTVHSKLWEVLFRSTPNWLDWTCPRPKVSLGESGFQAGKHTNTKKLKSRFKTTYCRVSDTFGTWKRHRSGRSRSSGQNGTSLEPREIQDAHFRIVESSVQQMGTIVRCPNCFLTLKNVFC